MSTAQLKKQLKSLQNSSTKSDTISTKSSGPVLVVKKAATKKTAAKLTSVGDNSLKGQAVRERAERRAAENSKKAQDAMLKVRSHYIFKETMMRYTNCEIRYGSDR